MRKVLIQYREFIDWHADTNGANFYSKKDLENYEHSAISANDRGNETLCRIFKALGPVFNSPTEVQKTALGNWESIFFIKVLLTV